MLAADNPYAVTPDTWIISDTHFYHENIGSIAAVQENWQELIIKNWNDQVAPGDTVLHLGDFALGKKTHFELLTGILNGKLFLIQGNHDRLSQIYCEAHGVTLIKNSFQIILDPKINLIFSHRPIVPLEDG
jgi:calcineurin-like phosphoesterase family protein